ncbi:hypothetical protein FSP39_022621 [Pinctada imbricata]|uniref:Major facilitator superfamily (MFS) profile domain-containing protein n=1 Tax=Pinctada imbricata TaxID=66713 RepID=A0AA88XU74_PINIB|nr:hypothetical protein FSP39_022621 [Pinctada imbricata]
MWLGFVILSVVNVLNGFSYTVAYYVINEFANVAIKDLYFPNVTLNSSDNVGCGDKNITAEEKHISDVVQEKVSQWSIYFSLGSGIPCLVATSIFSSLSDRYGRKRLLFLSLLGICLKMVLCSFFIYYKFNIYYFVLVGFVEGCSGNWITVLSVSFAYVADLTANGKYRSIAIAIYELVLNLGFYSGSLSAGLLIKYFNGYFYPSVISTAAIFLALVTVMFLPETSHDKNVVKNSNIFGQMKDLMRIFMKKSQNGDNLRLKYFFCITSLVCIWIPQIGGGSTELYYNLSYPICFNAEDVSFYTAIKGSSQQFITVMFIRIFQICDIRDETTAAVSCIFGIAHYVVYGFAKTKETLFIVAAIYTLKFACVPILRSTMSKLTPGDKQGSVFGAIAFFENICSMCGSAMAGAVYSATVPIYKGFVFFVMAGFNFVASALIM